MGFAAQIRRTGGDLVILLEDKSSATPTFDRRLGGTNESLKYKGVFRMEC